MIFGSVEEAREIRMCFLGKYLSSLVIYTVLYIVMFAAVRRSCQNFKFSKVADDIKKHTVRRSSQNFSFSKVDGD